MDKKSKIMIYFCYFLLRLILLFKIFLDCKKLIKIKNVLLENLLRYLKNNTINKIILICIEESGRPTYNFLREKIPKEMLLSEDSIAVSGYKNATTGKHFIITKELSMETLNNFMLAPLFGSNVCFVLVDDMIDSGGSYNAIYDYLKKNNINNFVFCFLIDKITGKRKHTPNNYFFGIRLETNLFLYGNGSDCRKKGRDLEFVCGVPKLVHDLMGFLGLDYLFVYFLKKLEQAMKKSV